MNKTNISKKELLEIQQNIEFDLKNYMRKRAFPNIAKFLNHSSVEHQVYAVHTLVDFYDQYPTEEDKLLTEFLKSYLPMQKYSALLIIAGISLQNPAFGFPKMAEALRSRKDVREFAANALKNSWKDQEEQLAENIVRYWDFRDNVDLKIVAVTSVNTKAEDEENRILDFLGRFIEDNDIQIRNHLVEKLKDFYIREPIVVEAKLREWLLQAQTQNPELTIVQMVREIAKRKDPFLLDRTSIIMKNWSQNEKLKETAQTVLQLLASNHIQRR
ncbi:MAG: hypothetical protein PHI40_01845 [Caldisericia bacterium]|nr:hypothetical protein [Caldisericia bacterium]MDD4614135.1 hypothetical protein [Caldisericia bacterium]